MAKLKIVFRKEVWIDINEYYPKFSPALRKTIDNAIYKMLGGQEKPAPKSNKPAKDITAIGVADAVIVRRTHKKSTVQSSKVYALCANYKSGTEYMAEEVINQGVNMQGLSKIHVMSNLVKGGYFEIVK